MAEDRIDTIHDDDIADEALDDLTWNRACYTPGFTCVASAVHRSA